jgi:hypothetical protein
LLLTRAPPAPNEHNDQLRELSQRILQAQRLWADGVADELLTIAVADDVRIQVMQCDAVYLHDVGHADQRCVFSKYHSGSHLTILGKNFGNFENPTGRCEAKHEDYGNCTREKDHDGSHRAAWHWIDK